MEYKEKTIDEAPKCGLCGKRLKLTKTKCCGRWICDDADKHVPFSNERASCYQNHDRFTLCAFHHSEKHRGNWESCKECRDSFKTEIYVYFGTNDYNFEKLANPPAFSPTRCAKCNRIINLGEESYTLDGTDVYCEECGPQFR